MRICAIIPTLNEEAQIDSLLAYLKNLDPHLQLIVSDGGSTDATVRIAGKQARVISAARGRGAQMNHGAAQVSEDILWFVHADCRPHPQSVRSIRQALLDPNTVGGAFEYNLDDRRFIFRLSEYLSNKKNKWLKLFYGDMGIFVRRAVFEKMGGYRQIPLMEDMDFCKRLKKMGTVVILPLKIGTSARRWRHEGILKNIVRNWALQLAWTLGASPEKLARWYRFDNRKS